MRQISRAFYQDELTPVVVDYLVKHNLAEVYSLQKILSYDDKSIRSCLSKLVEDGILVKYEQTVKYFTSQIAPKIEFDMESIHLGSHITRVDIYCFNRDLLFILKARFYELQSILAKKVEDQR